MKNHLQPARPLPTFPARLRVGGIALLASLSLVACQNSRTSRKIGTSSALTTAPTSQLAATTFKISRAEISVSTSTGAGQGSATTTVFFDATANSIPISNFCTSSGTGTGTAARPCVCSYSWQEVNTNSGSSVTIPHLVATVVNNVQANSVVCPAPDVYTTEIPNGIQIRISVLPGPSNTESFTSTPTTYVKSATNTIDGNFKDSQGRSFANIMRYSCYDQRLRGMSVVSKKGTRTNAQTGEARQYPIANRFCVAKASSNGQVPEGCEGLAPADYSAQSYYYNLFARESEAGDINPGNARYVCPTVQEGLYSNNGVGSQGQYYPLDRTFALSLGKTADFNIGVVANTKASNPADPASNSSTCDSTATTPSQPNSLVQSCLGFAARPNADGSCPYFRDATGSIRFTYRLRRFVALYPPAFDTDGSILNEPQPTDTVYIVDRPVNSAANADPFKPYTMLGPKPCPYSFFDSKKVLAGVSSYAGTNDTRWNGKNVDGIEFPRADAVNSCAAALPVLNADKTIMSVTTVHSRNAVADFQRVFVRPIKPFAPHYVEDTDFQACAPLADPFKDPPLHFAKTSDGNVSYCAETYPSQNNNVARLDDHTNPADISTPLTGNVRPFTSHVAKNSASAACTFSPLTLPTNYPAGGRARHPAGADLLDRDKNGTNITSERACDRTVVNPLNGVTWPRFPLLSPPSSVGGSMGVEEVLAGDSSYNCTVTFDGGGAKTGRFSPTQGCCGPNVQVWTGNAAAPNNAANAHLETDSSCQVPLY